MNYVKWHYQSYPEIWFLETLQETLIARVIQKNNLFAVKMRSSYSSDHHLSHHLSYSSDHYFSSYAFMTLEDAKAFAEKKASQLGLRVLTEQETNML